MTYSQLMPRRSELPVFLGFGFYTLLFLYVNPMKSFWQVIHMCESSICIAFGLAEPFIVLTFGFLGSFLVSTALRRTLYPRLELTDRFQCVFHPPTAVVVALFGVVTLSVIVLLASEYEVLYTTMGLALLYTFYAPFLNIFLLSKLYVDMVSSSIIAFGSFLILMAIAQVAWWYVLAYGLTGGYQQMKKVTSGWSQSS